MLSDYFLYSALGGYSSSYSSTFGSLTYPLTSPVTTSVSQAASALSDQIDSVQAKSDAYDQLLTAVNDFQSALSSFDFTDETTTTASAQSLVDAYNNLKDTVDTLTGSGGALEGDTTATQLVNSLQNQLSETFSGATGSYDALYQIGITPQSDGTLALDTSTLSTAYAADSAGVESLLSEAGSTFNAIADPYSTSGGIIESTASVTSDNLLNLQMALPALQSMADQTQTYADQQYAASIGQLYSYSLAESLFATYQSPSSTSFLA